MESKRARVRVGMKIAWKHAFANITNPFVMKEAGLEHHIIEDTSTLRYPAAASACSAVNPSEHQEHQGTIASTSRAPGSTATVQ